MNDEWWIIYEWFMHYLFMDDEFINYYLLKQNEDIDLLTCWELILIVFLA